MGYSLTASAMLSAIQGCQSEPSQPQATVTPGPEEWKPAFLNQEQLNLVAELGETIIPETDSPGAKTAGVHRYIDDELQFMYSTEDQFQFLKGLEDIEALAKREFGNSFEESALEQRIQILAEIEQEKGNDFFRQLKVMVCGGYFTSEIVCKEVLKYDPIPGQYEGCIDIDRSTPVWSI